MVQCVTYQFDTDLVAFITSNSAGVNASSIASPFYSSKMIRLRIALFSSDLLKCYTLEPSSGN